MLTINEYDYGGAYDIGPEDFFTKEELMEYGEDIAEKLGDRYDYDFELAEIYLEDDDLYIKLYIVDEDNYFVDTTNRIDMRRIKLPKDLNKYTEDFLEQLGLAVDEFIEVYKDDYDESLDESYEADGYHPCMSGSYYDDDLDNFTNELNDLYIENKGDSDLIILYNYDEANNIIEFNVFTDAYSGVVKEKAIIDIDKFDNGIKPEEVLKLFKSIKESANLTIAEEDNNIEDTEEDEEEMLNEALKLGDPWPHWTDVYKVFGLIQNMYKGKVDVINQKIKEFYNMFKGVKNVETAYQRWQSQE